MIRDDATLASAIARYHELCEDPNLAGPAVVAAFARAQQDAGLTFGGTVQCRSLRPALMTQPRLQLLRAAVATMWRAFARIEQRAISDPSLAGELGLSAQERELIAIDPGYTDATVVSRLDTFFGDRPRVLEYNADSPAGMSYQAGQAALMRELPVFARFAAEYPVQTLRADLALRETLLAVWKEFAARRDHAAGPPRIAIVDLPNAATSTEFLLVKKDFESQGIPTVIATPEDLALVDGRLYAFGQPIDLVYKRLLVADFLEHYDLQHPLVRAYAAGSVCVASSFRCTIAHKKRALAALWNPQHVNWFTQTEAAAIHALVPPTTTDLDAVDLSRTVFKPNDSHGGEGIVLGWELDRSKWREQLNGRRDDEYVAQERVPVQLAVYPVFDAAAPDAGAQLRPLIEDCNAYVFRGALGGILTRLSESPVINVSKGGQAIPTFILDSPGASV